MSEEQEVTRNVKSTSNAPTNSRNRLQQYEERVSGVSSQERNEVIPALALRSYHLPGNSWCDDWFQYFANNHPVLGICCHNRLHPIRMRMRIINLIGSIVFGLAVTNMIWLWFIYNEDDAQSPVLTLSLGGVSVGGANNATGAQIDDTNSNNNNNSQQQIEVTQGMVMLWTLGGGLHALFDNTIWYVTACVCCLPGRSLERLGKYKWCGSYIVVFVVVACTAFASFAVVLRATLDESQDNVELSDLDTGGLTDDKIDLSDGVSNASAYTFLIAYAIELVLALTVYYMIVGTILFSGVLGCGKIPILGGRPYEVMEEEKLKAREQAQGGGGGRRGDDSWETKDHTSTSRSNSPV